MVSKPKPGLGKGLVRTIQHGQHVSQHHHHHSLSFPSSSAAAAAAANSGTTSTAHNVVAPVTTDFQRGHALALDGAGSIDPSLYSRRVLYSPTPIPIRQFTTLSTSRPDFFSTSAFDFSLRRDLNLSLADFFPPPPPPSPGPPHPIPAPIPASHPRGLQASGVTPSPPPSNTPPALLFDAAPSLTRENIPSTLPDDALLRSPAYASRFIFRFGASGLAKDRPVIPSRRSHNPSPTPPPRPRSFPIPQVDAPTSFSSISIGEDAYYARPDSMCVADGVGGWARSGRGGADAGRWSRLLTHFCEVEVKSWWDGAEEYVERIPPGQGNGTDSAWAEKLWSGNIRLTARLKSATADDALGLPEGTRRRKLDPVEIMQRGFEKCLSCFLAEGIHGSSTCLLALLHHSTLLIANLGDCCLLVVRAGKVIFRTDEMQHAFNFPLQLGTHSRDEPMKDAKRHDVRVQRDDVVVVGSDGLMDNLFDEEIVECLEEFAPPSSTSTTTTSATSSRHRPLFDPQKVSETLCRAARQKSEDLNSETPFMLRAAAEGIDFVGGKKDDISVIVGVIGARNDEGVNESLKFKTT